ncbi:MAG: class I SAM-dependent methyltransferase [Leptolyngbyaceae cyanobacterium]
MQKRVKPTDTLSRQSNDELWQFRPWRSKGYLSHFWDQLNLIDYWRRLHMNLRFRWYCLFSSIKTLENPDKGVATETIRHNLKGLRDTSVVRSNALVRPLSVIEELSPDSQLLCIGPRTEGELYNLAAHGFKLSQIEAVDLISYSPKIQLGDMHALPFTDDKFDAVICGWTIAYSDNKVKAAREMMRVVRNGGIIAIGVEYHPLSTEEIENMTGYLPGSFERLNTLEDVHELFENNIDYIFFSQEPRGRQRDKIGSIISIFSIKKHM